MEKWKKLSTLAKWYIGLALLYILLFFIVPDRGLIFSFLTINILISILIGGIVFLIYLLPDKTENLGRAVLIAILVTNYFAIILNLLMFFFIGLVQVHMH